MKRWIKALPFEDVAPVEREVLTVEEAAAFLRVGARAVYEAVGRGEVPHVRVGKTIRMARSALVLWLRGTSGIRT